jgi:Fic family protein
VHVSIYIMIRTYESTHPWITFSSTRIPRAGARLWSLLGECQSKVEHIAGVPLRPEVATKLHRLYLAKGALATTAIEGNTLSEEEALEAVDGRLSLPPSREYLATEIENILNAYNLMLKDVSARRLPRLTTEAIKGWNSDVLKGLTLEPGVVPGEIRTHSVGVSRYRGAPAADCAYLMDRLCEWLASDELKGGKGTETMFAVLRAVFAHLYIAWIHPFGDGNGRTARLVEYEILLACGVPSPAIMLLSNHYNKTRAEYYRQLDRASGSGGDYVPFVEYAVQGLADGLREQLAEIRTYQLTVAWTNYIHELFDDRKSPVDRRRRDLVLELSKQSLPIPMRKIRELSSRLTEAYVNRTYMTLDRDLAVLARMGLISRGREGVTANRSIVEAFLPFRAPVPNEQEAS